MLHKKAFLSGFILRILVLTLFSESKVANIKQNSVTGIKSDLPDSNSFLEVSNLHLCPKKDNRINLCGIYFLSSYFPVLFFLHVVAEVIVPFNHQRAARSLKIPSVTYLCYCSKLVKFPSYIARKIPSKIFFYSQNVMRNQRIFLPEIIFFLEKTEFKMVKYYILSWHNSFSLSKQ